MKTKIVINKENFLIKSSVEDILNASRFLKTSVGRYEMISDGNGAFEQLIPRVIWEEKYINVEQITFIEVKENE